jgi:hypothetical protein
MHNLKSLALANPGNLDILKSIIKINLIQQPKKCGIEAPLVSPVFGRKSR